MPSIHASDKSGTKKPVIGTGDHVYEVHHDWGELPAGLAYGNCHGVREDSQGRIFIHHTVNASSASDDTMVIFDEKGKFIKSWGKQFKGGAHGLHLEKEGKQEFLYLCDTKQAIVVKTTLDGEILWQLGYPKESDFYRQDPDPKKVVKYSPTNLAVSANGDVFVGDGYGSSYVNKYDKSGKFIKTFGGGKTRDAGSLNSPHGIYIDKRSGKEELVVADRSNNRLQYFDLDGKHSRFVSYGDKSLPCHFHFRRDLMLIPDLGARVVILDKNNKLVANLGDDSGSQWRETRKLPRDKFTPGKFVCPHGACFDHKGNIFVAEWVEAGRVTKLRKV
jgi:hypothetical protein